MKLTLGAVVVGLTAYGIEAGPDEILEAMFQSFDTWPCSRIITRDGPIGCGSQEDLEVGQGGVLYRINSKDQLSTLASNGVPDSIGESLSIVMDVELLDRASMDSLITIHQNKRIDNVIVTDADGKADLGGRNPATPSDWNLVGDGLSYLNVPFTVTMVKAQEDAQTIINFAQENSDRGFRDGTFTRGARFQFYQGKSTVTAQQCIDWRKCEPLGGLSIWGTIGDTPDTKDKVLVTTGLDSSAFFHDLAFGRNQAASGIAATLLAAKALSDVSNKTAVTDLPKQVVFALFQGEVWDRTGSKRFVKDISSGKGCESLDTAFNSWGCGKPLVYSRAWENVTLDMITDVIAVDQVAAGEFFMHAPDGSSLQTLVADVSAQSSLADINVKPSTRADASFPPSPLDSLLEVSSWNGTGLVLSGYDQAYSNTAYLSQFDVSTGSEATTAKHIGQLATVLARSAFVAAGGDVADAVALVNVNQEHATKLWDCLSVNFVCQLVADTLGMTMDQLKAYKSSFGVTSRGHQSEGPVPLFSSVYRTRMVEYNSARPMERFVRMYLSRLNADDLVKDDETACTFDIDCSKSMKPECPLGVSSSMCLDKKCVCPTFFFHDAMPVSLSYDAQRNWYKVEDPQGSLYTEPIWAQPTLTVFFESPRSVTNIALTVAGVASTIATWVFLSRAKVKLSGSKLKLE